MPSTFTIRNTGDTSLDVQVLGGGQPRTANVTPGEEQTFAVDQNTHVQVREGEMTSEPKRGE